MDAAASRAGLSSLPFFVLGFFLKYFNFKTLLCTCMNKLVDAKFKCFRNMQIITFFCMKGCVEARKLNIDTEGIKFWGLSLWL